MENNKEDFVDYGLAGMLKNLGFNWGTAYYYDAFSKEHQICYSSTLSNHNCFNDEASAPTLYLAQKWLREEKNIVVEVFYNTSGYSCNAVKTDGAFIHAFDSCDNSYNGGMFDDYESALINALKYTCKYLLKQK